MKTIALKKTVTDTASGTAPVHHVLAAYQVDPINKRTAATLGSYMTAKATVPVAHVTVQIPGVPEGDGTQWIYDQIVAATGEGNALAGAVAVTEASA